ncbi:TrmH family RNA methyltransferase [Gilvimarinus sp. F26214L]|uniref:TrmH family RNA methyltransferase n=1 Tax=Gilvimarinus sp. DZF01 TaxID=3461371 RepID=UPI0040467B8E
MSPPFAKPSNLLTIYGRKPVQEALHDDSIEFFRVHLADSNKPNDVLRDIENQCRRRGIEVRQHDRMGLSRISRNRKQDQGVAADIIAGNFREFADFLKTEPGDFTLIALDRITNPQNLGMIIRSVCAGYVDGLLLPRRGCAKLDSLVIKASAGTLFRAPILFCDELPGALQAARSQGIHVFGLALENSRALGHTLDVPRILVLGNETEGLSEEVSALCDQRIHIPMRNGVESLNVAVTAGILAFHPTIGANDRQ